MLCLCVAWLSWMAFWKTRARTRSWRYHLRSSITPSSKMGRIIPGGGMATMVSWQSWFILITITPQSCQAFPLLIQHLNCQSRAWRPSRTSGRRTRIVTMPKSPSPTIWLCPDLALEFLSRSFPSPMVWLADSLWGVLCTWMSARYITQSVSQVNRSTATHTR